jgi:hypothetical protein
MEIKVIRTQGRARLDSPRDFAQASLWCETLSNSNVSPPEWTVRCFVFRGDRLADVRERSGRGNSAPINAYR